MDPTKTTYKNYVSHALRTEAEVSSAAGRLLTDTRKLRLLHAGMGLCTEAGEFLDALKKHIFYGAPLDLVNLREEGGDLFWYLAIMADVLGERTFNSMLQSNIAKLKVRYPDAFSEVHASKRDIKAERNKLEEHLEKEYL